MVSVRVTSWNRHNQSPKKKKEQGLRLKIKHKRLQCDYNSNNYNITSSACIAIVIVNIVMHNKSQRKKRQTTEEDQLLIIRANFGSIKNTTMTFCACCLIVALTSTKEGEKRDILKAKCLLACLKSGVVRGRERLWLNTNRVIDIPCRTSRLCQKKNGGKMEKRRKTEMYYSTSVMTINI